MNTDATTATEIPAIAPRESPVVDPIRPIKFQLSALTEFLNVSFLDLKLGLSNRRPKKMKET